MEARRGHGLARCAVGVGLFFAAGARLTAAGDTDGDDLARARLYTLRLRFEAASVASVGRCGGMGLADLDVRLGGRPLLDRSRADLERVPQPTLHALLIDTSSSMGGRLDQARDAAAAYIGTLRPAIDQGLIATFDDSLILTQAPTGDPARLLAAVEQVRLGWSTSLLDGLHDVVRLLARRRERPVLLLLSDGVDTASLQDRDDVRAVLASRPDLTVFTIGLGLPPLTARGPAGTSSTRKFLQQLADTTDGRFFDVATAGRLDATFGAIRELLDNEATLSVVDPEPEGDARPLTIRSRVPGCRVRVYRQRPDARHEPLAPVTVGGRMKLGANASWFTRLRLRQLVAAPACGAQLTPEGLGASSGWMVLDGQRLGGCVVDLTLDHGLLYDPSQPQWVRDNTWIKLRLRPFEVPVPAPEALPDDPAALMDRLAAHAWRVRADPIDLDPRLTPPERHARPFHDYPWLVNGRTLFEMQPQLTAALAAIPAYGSWARARLHDDAQAELGRLAARLARHAHGLSAAAVAAIARASPAGQAILERAARPGADDLVPYLASWAGDVPAQTLFARWEARRIDARWLGARSAAHAAEPSFTEAWSELRRVFFVPSYARVLALLAPVRDRPASPIGFWRIVLPRPAWLIERARGYEKHPDWSSLPLDLVPDTPLGYTLVEQVLSTRPALAEHLRVGGFRATPVRYTLTGKAYRQDPGRAFRAARVEVRLEAPAQAGKEPAYLDLSADVTGVDGGRGSPLRLVNPGLVPVGDTRLEELCGPLAPAPARLSGSRRHQAPPSRSRGLRPRSARRPA